MPNNPTPNNPNTVPFTAERQKALEEIQSLHNENYAPPKLHDTNVQNIKAKQDLEAALAKEFDSEEHKVSQNNYKSLSTPMPLLDKKSLFNVKHSYSPLTHLESILPLPPRILGRTSKLLAPLYYWKNKGRKGAEDAATVAAQAEWIQKNSTELQKQDKGARLEAIKMETRYLKEKLITFYFGKDAIKNDAIKNALLKDGNLDEAQIPSAYLKTKNFKLLKDAYGDKAIDQINSQLKAYDDRAIDLEKKVDEFQKKDGEIFQQELRERVKRETERQAENNYRAAKQPWSPFKTTNDSLEFSTDGDEAPNMDHEQILKFRSWGIDITQTRTEKGWTYEMSHKSSSFFDAFVDGMPFRATREDKAMDTMLDACFRTKNLKRISINGGSESQRRNFWLKVKMREAEMRLKMNDPNYTIDVIGYSPTAYDLWSLKHSAPTTLDSAFTNKKQEVLSQLDTRQAAMQLLKSDASAKDNHAIQVDFATWFDKEGEADFNKWAKSKGYKLAENIDKDGIPVTRTRTDMVKEWWQEGADPAQNKVSKAQDKFEAWASEKGISKDQFETPYSKAIKS